MQTSQASNVNDTDVTWKWLYLIGAAATLVVIILFFIGVIGIITVVLEPVPSSSWFTQIQNNWLVVLFKLNAGVSGLQLDLLNLLDISIMALFCVIFLALYAALKRTSRAWSLVAAVLPFIGIPVFLLTATAGRSSLLIGGLMFSVIMLRSNIFSRTTAYVGIVTCTLLFFAGDIATAIYSSSSIIALSIGLGYVLWILWLLLLTRRLYPLEQGI